MDEADDHAHGSQESGRWCAACGRELGLLPHGEDEHCDCCPNVELRVLRAIRRRPSMYWGNRPSHFDALIGFIEGFSCGVWATRDPESVSRVKSLVPEGFHEFVWRRVGKGPMGARGWQWAIRNATQSDKEAFELFFELREAFELERPKEPVDA